MTDFGGVPVVLDQAWFDALFSRSIDASSES